MITITKEDYKKALMEAYTKGVNDQIERTRAFLTNNKAKQKASYDELFKEEVKTPTLEKRKFEFMKTVAEYRGAYTDSMLQHFFEYWTEPNKSKTKMRFEQQKTWKISRRLKTWKRNDYGNNRSSNDADKQRKEWLVGYTAEAIGQSNKGH